MTCILRDVGKRYAVLCSYSNEMKDVQHAAIAVCVDIAPYITVLEEHNILFADVYNALFFLKNFREALKEEWKVSLSHRAKLNVYFEESTARVEYPSSLNGWNIISSSPDCVVSHEFIALIM